MNVLPSGRRAPRLTRRAVVVSTSTALLAVTAGIGYAAWSVSATGSSQASSGSVSAGVVAVATPVASLYPGASTAVYFTVSNPNAFPVTYNAVTFGTVSVSGDPTTCNPATYVTTTVPTVSIAVAANTTSTVQSPAGAITLSSSAPDACQGRTFTVVTSLTGVSS